MYDLRRTMYDLGVPALARECGEANAVAELWSSVRTPLESGGGRRGLPMYDVQHARRPR